MNRVFISYSGHRIQRAALHRALCDHGLTPWRDVESLLLGDDTTETIEAELAECSGVILWLNQEALDSDYVAHVELPAILHAWQQRRIRIALIFDGMSPRVAIDALRALGFELGENNGIVIDPALDGDDTAAQIAQSYARGHLQSASSSGARPVVRLVSYDDTAPHRDDAVLNFDWRHRIHDGSVDPVSESHLRDALSVATAALKAAYGSCEIEVAIKAHLPLAVALGHAFAEPTGCVLRMTRDGQVTLTTREPTGAGLLEEHPYPRGPASSHVAALELSVSRAVKAGVNAYVALGHRYRHRLALEPHEGAARDSIANDAATNTWGRQTADMIVGLADRGDVERVQLFLSTTVELAVVAGWWMNAAGPVDLMNWRDKTGPYERMWTLP